MSEPCHNCDRVDCATFTMPAAQLNLHTDPPECVQLQLDREAAMADCRGHAVDWRSQAMAQRSAIAAVRYAAEVWSAAPGAGVFAGIRSCGVALLRMLNRDRSGTETVGVDLAKEVGRG